MLGSIVAISDATGSATINRYDEHGAHQGTLTGRFGYTGQAWLPEAGLYHYRARAYNPTLGRFMQTDPIGYGSGMNLYAYVLNDPVNLVDPDGLQQRIEVIGNPPRPQDWFNATLNYIDIRNLLSRMNGSTTSASRGRMWWSRERDCRAVLRLGKDRSS